MTPLGFACAGDAGAHSSDRGEGLPQDEPARALEPAGAWNLWKLLIAQVLSTIVSGTKGLASTGSACAAPAPFLLGTQFFVLYDPLFGLYQVHFHRYAV